MLNIQILPVGELQANCYIITKDGSTTIIDPGAEFEKIITITDSLHITDILITHHHEDHIGALQQLEKRYQIEHNKIKNNEIQVIKTPGHTKDSTSFYFPKEKILFSGDFIFQKGIGRWDLETGSLEEMQESIKKILTYPDIAIYPGHGSPTTLKQEEKYLRQFL